MFDGAYLTTGGPIFLGVMIGLTEVLGWPRKVQYIWALIAILWGVAALYV